MYKTINVNDKNMNVWDYDRDAFVKSDTNRLYRVDMSTGERWFRLAEEASAPVLLYISNDGNLLSARSMPAGATITSDSGRTYTVVIAKARESNEANFFWYDKNATEVKEVNRYKSIVLASGPMLRAAYCDLGSIYESNDHTMHIVEDHDNSNWFVPMDVKSDPTLTHYLIANLRGHYAKDNLPGYTLTDHDGVTHKVVLVMQDDMEVKRFKPIGKKPEPKVITPDTIEVLKLQVVKRADRDDILLTINRETGGWPYYGNAVLLLQVDKGTGVDYCRKHFPNVAIEVD